MHFTCTEEGEGDADGLLRTNSSIREYSIRAVLLIFSVPALGGGLFGFDIGATSYTIAQMVSEADRSSHDWTGYVGSSPVWQGILVAAASIGAWLGSCWIQHVADRIGRRKELGMGAWIYAIGTILQVLGGQIPQWYGLASFGLGRLVYGTAIGIVMHGAPTYLAEQSPTPVRGLLVCAKEAAIVTGILLGYIVGEIFTHSPKGWTIAYSCSFVLSIPMGVLVTVIPQSCRWLLLQHRPADALKSLKFVWTSPGAAERELQLILSLHPMEENDPNLPEQADVSRSPIPWPSTTNELDVELLPHEPHAHSTTIRSSYSFLYDEQYRAPLVAGVGLIVLQQISGQPSVLSYATPIFQSIGLAKSSSILIASFKLIATLVAAISVEKTGRKRLLFTGISLMFVALIILSLTIGKFSSNANGAVTIVTSTTKTNSWILLIAMFLYIGGYQFSFGPIAWLVISEVFPLSVRGVAVAFAVQTNFLCNALVQVSIPTFAEWIGWDRTFAIFAVITAYSIYFVHRFIPETKGLSLEQIECQFRDRSSA